MPRGEEVHSKRELNATEGVGQPFRCSDGAVSQRLNSLSTRDTQLIRARRLSTCGLRCSPCTHHSLKCSQLLLNRR